MACDVHHGDCLKILQTFRADTFDAVVTDPPAGISFMGREWDGDKGGRDQWVAWMREVAVECLRVVKPGAHALVWALPRTSHWTATAWEDAGWEVRDRVAHLFGTGFPKSLDVSKAIDKAAGHSRGTTPDTRNGPNTNQATKGDKFSGGYAGQIKLDAGSVSPEAAQWAGWGTALKPAVQDWWLLRKPLSEKTVAANMLQHGCGALNIDACRVATDEVRSAGGSRRSGGIMGASEPLGGWQSPPGLGRWPANVLHDGSPEVEAAFAAFGERASPASYTRSSRAEGAWLHAKEAGTTQLGFGDTGTASRFFMKCEPGESELIVWRAKTIFAQWNHELANTADEDSFLSNEAVVSALSGAVTSGSRGGRALIQTSNFRVPSTSVTPSELRRISEAAITAILNIESGCLPEWRHEKPIHNGCLVKCVETDVRTGTTTITINHWKSDGSAERVTFDITQTNSAHGEVGLAADNRRFHYSAKASKRDRAGSKHPTVKPLSLMSWLCKLVTPPGGTILDPFAGSGTTLQAAMECGFSAVGIEREREYVADIKSRLKNANPLFAEVAA